MDTSPKEKEQIRSESVQEILGKVPNILILWGNTMIFILVFGIIVFSYFIRYPVKMEVKLEFLPVSENEKIYAPVSGILNQWNTESGQVVKKESLLGLIICEDGSSLEIKSPIKGRVYSSSLGDNIWVHENDLLYSIVTLEIHDQKPLFKINAYVAKKIPLGQEIEIILSGNNQETRFLSGYVDQVSNKLNDIYVLQILPLNEADFYADEYSQRIFGIEQNATLIVDRPRALEYFFYSALNAIDSKAPVY